VSHIVNYEVYLLINQVLRFYGISGTILLASLLVCASILSLDMVDNSARIISPGVMHFYPEPVLSPLPILPAIIDCLALIIGLALFL
jgi:hypothetical protein